MIQARSTEAGLNVGLAIFSASSRAMNRARRFGLEPGRLLQKKRQASPQMIRSAVMKSAFAPL